MHRDAAKRCGVEIDSVASQLGGSSTDLYAELELPSLVRAVCLSVRIQWRREMASVSDLCGVREGRGFAAGNGKRVVKAFRCGSPLFGAPDIELPTTVETLGYVDGIH